MVFLNRQLVGTLSHPLHCWDSPEDTRNLAPNSQSSDQIILPRSSSSQLHGCKSRVYTDSNLLRGTGRLWISIKYRHLPPAVSMPAVSIVILKIIISVQAIMTLEGTVTACCANVNNTRIFKMWIFHTTGTNGPFRAVMVYLVNLVSIHAC